VPAFIFDLDGTLVDRVYQHVVSWQAALRSEGFDLSVWRIHRRIGMSGGLLVRALMRELQRPLDDETVKRLTEKHAGEFLGRVASVQPLPGADALLAELRDRDIPFAIATSGGEGTAKPLLDVLHIPPGTHVITRERVKRAKPDPDLLLTAAADLHADATQATVVGDSVWDMLAARRAGYLGVGVLAGGYGAAELESAGAYRVYADPDDMRLHLDELGIREE